MTEAACAHLVHIHGPCPGWTSRSRVPPRQRGSARQPARCSPWAAPKVVHQIPAASPTASAVAPGVSGSRRNLTRVLQAGRCDSGAACRDGVLAGRPGTAVLSLHSVERSEVTITLVLLDDTRDDHTATAYDLRPKPAQFRNRWVWRCQFRPLAVDRRGLLGLRQPHGLSGGSLPAARSPDTDPPDATGKAHQAMGNLATYSSKGSMPTSARSSSMRSGSSQGQGTGAPSFTPAI